MSEETEAVYDFCVVGSGFAGSIMAMGLKQSGYKVCMIEKEKHPRFAIGESSTPIADMILRDLSEKYDLPFLGKISRYGEWQGNYPEVICGLKRGFSYYSHQKGKIFSGSHNHENELLVAASENDENSDTNWLRSDVDAFLVKQANKIGVDVFDETGIAGLTRNRDEKTWNAICQRISKRVTLKCKWIIDATGSPVFSKNFLGTESTSEDFYTNSEAVFTHFEEVPHWLQYLNNRGIYTDDYPYNPDRSALHQIIEEGWAWMLRFKNDLLSAGLLFDRDSHFPDEKKNAEVLWADTVGNYPSLNKLFNNARLAKIPGQFYRTGRLQRKLDRTFGEGWVALNHTTGFVDPLHSTGIAFALCGVEKLLDVYSKQMEEKEIHDHLKIIQDQTFKELQFIDLIVSAGYKSRWNFKLFSAAVILYFIASVQYEQSRLKGVIPNTFLYADDMEIFEIISATHLEINKLDQDRSVSQMNELINRIKERIAPFNSVGLMDDEKMNMYVHTAVTL